MILSTDVWSFRFVTFGSEEEAERGISMFNGTRVNGQTLRVDYTKTFKEQKAQNSSMYTFAKQHFCGSVHNFFT